MLKSRLGPKFNLFLESLRLLLSWLWLYAGLAILWICIEFVVLSAAMTGTHLPSVRMFINKFGFLCLTSYWAPATIVAASCWFWLKRSLKTWSQFQWKLSPKGLSCLFRANSTALSQVSLAQLRSKTVLKLYFSSETEVKLQSFRSAKG